MRVRLRQFIRIYRRVLIFLAVIFFVAIFVVTYGGFYPVAVVNGDWILARHFRTHLAAAKEYETSTTGTSTVSSVLKGSDLTVSVLDGLIEEVLIERGARSEFGDRFEPLRAERVGHFMDQSAVISAEAKRYGLNSQQFEKEIVIPQVTRDLLSGRLFLKPIRLEDWLTAQKRSPSVAIFSKIFHWNGEQVTVQ